MTSPETPPEYQFLVQLLTNMEAGLKESLERVEKNMSERMDRFERRMDEYVLEKVFEERLTAIQTQLKEMKENSKQGKTWLIAVSGVIVGALSLATTIILALNG